VEKNYIIFDLTVIHIQTGHAILDCVI